MTARPAINSDVRAAIRAWVANTSGLPLAQVIWARQKAGTPAYPYITMDLTLRRVGHDWVKTFDNPASNGEDGVELEHRASGLRAGALRLRAHTSADSIDPSPVSILDAVQSKVRLPSQRAALQLVRVGVLMFEPIIPIDGTVGGLMEPRAELVARLLLPSEVSEFGTYIETVEITDEGAQP